MDKVHSIKNESPVISNLERRFNESLKIINQLLQEIKETNDEIDRMVYDLYGLSEDEIRIVEEQ